MYENIIKRSDANFSGTTAISYIANKIRQSDKENSVDIIEVGGTSVLQLKQQVGEEKIPHLDLLERRQHLGTVYR